MHLQVVDASVHVAVAVAVAVAVWPLLRWPWPRMWMRLLLAVDPGGAVFWVAAKAGGQDRLRQQQHDIE